MRLYHHHAHSQMSLVVVTASLPTTRDQRRHCQPGRVSLSSSLTIQPNCGELEAFNQFETSGT